MAKKHVSKFFILSGWQGLGGGPKQQNFDPIFFFLQKQLIYDFWAGNNYPDLPHFQGV